MVNHHLQLLKNAPKSLSLLMFGSLTASLH